MLAFTIFITHGLACYVAIDITWNEYISKRIKNYNSFWEYVTRTLLVFSTCKQPNLLQTSKLLLFVPLSFACGCDSQLGAVHFLVWSFMPFSPRPGFPGVNSDMRLLEHNKWNGEGLYGN